MTNKIGSVFRTITISADGYAAGLNHTEERPFGDCGDSPNAKPHARKLVDDIFSYRLAGPTHGKVALVVIQADEDPTKRRAPSATPSCWPAWWASAW